MREFMKRHNSYYFHCLMRGVHSLELKGFATKDKEILISGHDAKAALIIKNMTALS